MEELIKTESTEVLAFAGYKDFEAAADRTANKIKEGFMEMGYILKMARDTDILQDSEYTDYQDFAKRRYQLDPGTVSRYIRIVQNFSVDGNSHVLKDQYKDFGFAKLTIMLSIPDAINEALPPTLSKTEIQTIKDEVDAESQVSDIEVEIEKAEAAAVTDKPMLPPEGTPLQRNLWQLGKEQEELFRKLCKACELPFPDYEEIMDILILQGDAVYTVRIPGERRTQIIVNSMGATVINMKTLESYKYDKEELCNTVINLIQHGCDKPEEAYRKLYGMEMSGATTEKNTEVAPVQQDQKKETRKESKVIKAKPEKNKPQEPEKKPEQMTIPGAEPDPVPEEPETQVTDSCSGESEPDNQDTDTMGTEEQVPGQTDLERDYPQYCPDADKRTAYLQSIRGAVDNLVRYAEMDLIGAARQQVTDISGYLDKLDELIKEADSNAEAVEAGESEGV